MQKGHRRAKVLFGQLSPNHVAAVASAEPAREPVPLVFETPTLFKVDPLTPSLGAEIFDLDYAKAIARDPEVLKQIHETFTRYKVVMFRKTGLDRESHKKFLAALTNYWGLDAPQNAQQKETFKDGLFVHPYLPQIKDDPNVWPVDARQGNGWGRFEQGVEKQQNDYYRYMDEKTDRPGGAHGAGSPKAGGGYTLAGNIRGGANVFHSDNGFVEQPSSVSTLRAVKLPPVGGDTVFANMEQAYEDLDDAMKAKLAECTAVNGPHGSHGDWQNAANKFGGEAADRFRYLCDTFPPCVYPAVRTHPVTGKKAIFVNAGFTKSIQGPCVEAEGGSKEFLSKLYALARVPEYQCRMRWKNETDIIMWDNRSLVHYAVSDYGSENGGPRWMDHVATLGSTPYY